MRQEGGTEAPAERAQILVVMAMLVPVLLIFVGVAIDGSRLFQARLDAQILADRAADAGAQQVDITAGAVVRAGSPAQLVQGGGRGSAYAAAADVFASRGAPLADSLGARSDLTRSDSDRAADARASTDRAGHEASDACSDTATHRRSEGHACSNSGADCRTDGSGRTELRLVELVKR